MRMEGKGDGIVVEMKRDSGGKKKKKLDCYVYVFLDAGISIVDKNFAGIQY